LIDNIQRFSRKVKPGPLSEILLKKGIAMKPQLKTVYCLLVTFFLTVAASLQAQAPQLINYQGKLVINGEPVRTPQQITFTIYDAPTGGNIKWREVQNVPVSNGIFNVLLGSVTPFPSDLFTGTEQRWLALNVGNNPPLGQRTQITSVAYALKANSANALDAPDGDPPNALVVDNNGNVGIGTTSPSEKLVVGKDLGSFGEEAVVVGSDGNSGFSAGSSNTDRVQLGWANSTFCSNLPKGGFLGVTSLTPTPFYINPCNSGSNVIISPGGGNVGIGTTSPDSRLHVKASGVGWQNHLVLEGSENGSDWDILVDSGLPGAYKNALRFRNDASQQEALTLLTNGNVGIGTPSPRARLDVAGDICGNLITCQSSRRWKTNIQPIAGALEKVRQLRGVSYVWKEDGKPNIGLIAEEVAEVIPEVVSFEENGKDARAIDYSRLVAVLIEAVKEQQSKIADLEGRLKAVEATPK
jgi:hypothetical protein